MKRALAAVLAACALAAQGAEPLPAADLREEVLRTSVTVRDLFGRAETRSIAVTAFRPRGDGPFPLVIVNHGRAATDRRSEQGRQRYEVQSRYLVSKGFAVLVPTRVGYGDTYGDFDPEYPGGCNAMRPDAAAQAAAEQVLATVAFAKTLPWIDASRWVTMGVSLGGFTTLAVASRNPPGLVAAINFAGGHGGRHETHPGDPCSPVSLSRLWHALAATAPLPTLWLYWNNDRYWGAEWPKRWAQAWRDGGGQAELVQLPDVGSDGHTGFVADLDHWVPLVEAHLARAGFAQPGLVPRPPATSFAALDEAERVPASPTVRTGLYQRFLAAKKPRAFAVGANGAAGFANGDWALGRALGFCQARHGAPCRLYAVDDEVVWAP